MGNDRQNQWQITEGNHDFRYQRISRLNAALKPNQASGRYRYQDAVPI
jgi:predicted phosphohydrolase